MCARALENLDTVHLVHAQVRDDDVRARRYDPLYCVPWRSGGFRLIARVGQLRREELANLGLIVNEQNACHLVSSFIRITPVVCSG